MTQNPVGFRFADKDMQQRLFQKRKPFLYPPMPPASLDELEERLSRPMPAVIDLMHHLASSGQP